MLFCLQFFFFFFLLRIFTYSYSLQLERLHLSYFMECKLHDLDKEQFLDVIDNICKGRILNLSKGTCNLCIKFKLQLFYRDSCCTCQTLLLWSQAQYFYFQTVERNAEEKVPRRTRT